MEQDLDYKEIGRNIRYYCCLKHTKAKWVLSRERSLLQHREQYFDFTPAEYSSLPMLVAPNIISFI